MPSFSSPSGRVTAAARPDSTKGETRRLPTRLPEAASTISNVPLIRSPSLSENVSRRVGVVVFTCQVPEASALNGGPACRLFPDRGRKLYVTVSLGGLAVALAELTRFHWPTADSSAARRPMVERGAFSEAQVCARSVTSAVIQPSSPQAGLPLVSLEVAYLVCIAGRLVQRLAAVAASADHTSHAFGLQSVFAEWKFHRLTLALLTRASAIGAVPQVMYDWAVRGVPLAFLVPGLPKSSSVSVDQSRVSPCWTYVSKRLPSAEVEGSTVTGKRVFGSARKRASGVTTRSNEEPLWTTFIATGTRRVCSPDRWSTVESHITGAGITARRSPLLRSVNTTLPSACCSARSPLARSGRV